MQGSIEKQGRGQEEYRHCIGKTIDYVTTLSGKQLRAPHGTVHEEIISFFKISKKLVFEL